MKHLLNLKDLSATEIEDILDRAARIKAEPDSFRQLLAYKSMAMLFQKTSTRTRVSFEAAMTELGGHAIYIDWTTSNFVLSGIEYEAEYLSRNVSCIMARLMKHEDLLRIMAASSVPVINGCDEKYHPCQALTDLLTIKEHHAGNLDTAHLVYVGVQNNVSNSLITICDKLGVRLTIATPAEEGNGENLDADVQEILRSSRSINHTTDAASAVRDADFVYTDTWVDMQYFNNPEYEDLKNARVKQMLPYQLNEALIAGLPCKVMHDMPIHEGYEISAALVHDPRSIIFDQAENRMHAQKGLLWWLYEQAGLID